LGNSTLLVDNVSNLAVPSVERFSIWSRKQKRCFQRIKTGMKVAEIEHSSLRFLTLTTKKNENTRNLNDDFQVLRKRIIRMTPLKLASLGWIDLADIHRFYPSKKIGSSLIFEYCKVETSEGGGVLHVIFKGDFIPQKWISENWSEIRCGSWNVDIRICKASHGAYVVNQYMSGQSAFERFSWSFGWVYRGFVHDWLMIKRSTRPILEQERNFKNKGWDKKFGYPDIKLALSRWNDWLLDKFKPIYQNTFNGSVVQIFRLQENWVSVGKLRVNSGRFLRGCACVKN